MQPQQSGLLPAADVESTAHSERVATFIREKIAAAGGVISFAEFMQHALYAPGLGYYSAGTTKFGAAGDFVTAPEVSPIFARVLARQCAAVLTAHQGSSILEVGAGSGRLAVDLLSALAECDALPKSYRILEVSADLRERQETLVRGELPHLAEYVTWLDRLPEEHAGVMIANEVLDAMPVERFVRRASGVAQLCVGAEKSGFVIEHRLAPDRLVDAVMAIEKDLGRELAAGYLSEVSLAAPAWIADVARVLRQGVMFLFDYGVSRSEYYADDRSGGWLRCHFRHHAHSNALILPGIQDLTAWVDFTAVADAAHKHGLDIAGFVTQAQFLINGGLEEEIADIAELPLEAQLQLSGQIKLLTLPGEMGEHFKCLGLSRGLSPTLDAFTTSDRTASL